MTNITEIIEKAAERHTEAYFNSPETKGPGDHFTAGASFSLSSPEVLREVLTNFYAWKEKILIADKWYSTKELISKYITETIKPKEDVDNKVV